MVRLPLQRLLDGGLELLFGNSLKSFHDNSKAVSEELRASQGCNTARD